MRSSELMPPTPRSTFAQGSALKGGFVGLWNNFTIYSRKEVGAYNHSCVADVGAGKFDIAVTLTEQNGKLKRGLGPLYLQMVEVEEGQQAISRNTSRGKKVFETFTKPKAAAAEKTRHLGTGGKRVKMKNKFN